MTKLTITVFGSTGRQGSSVVRSLLSSGGYNIRAQTRDITSEKALKLKELGAELVKCDYSDSKEDIAKVLTGSDGVFLVTVMDVTGKTKESDIGIKIADAAKSVGIKHFVYSGLSECFKTSNGRFYVPHFDQKYEVEEHLKTLSVSSCGGCVDESSSSSPSFISSFVYAPFYYQNFITYFPPKKQDDGTTYEISIPSDPVSGKPLDMGDVDDIGSIVLAIFNDKSKYSGVTIPFTGTTIKGPEIVDIISKHTGKKVIYKYLPPAVLATFPVPGAKEIASMFSFYNEFGAFNVLDKSIAHKITKLTTFEEWLKKVNFKIE